MAELQINSVIVCDDIRQELSGKQILIGVYSGDIIVGLPDGMSGSINTWIWIELRIDTIGDVSYDFKAELSSKPIFGMDGIKVAVHTPGDVSLPLGPFPIQIRGAAEVKFYLRISGKKWRLIKTKKIITGPTINPSAIESPPPS